jgi:hypothetical protein
MNITAMKINGREQHCVSSPEDVSTNYPHFPNALICNENETVKMFVTFNQKFRSERGRQRFQHKSHE